MVDLHNKFLELPVTRLRTGEMLNRKEKIKQKPNTSKPLVNRRCSFSP